MQWNACIMLTKKLTIFNFIQLGFFISVLQEFFHHLSITLIYFHLLTFINIVCSEIPCSIVSCFVEASYLTFVALQLTGCHMMRYLGVLNIRTNYRFYIFWMMFFANFLDDNY